MLWSVSGGLSRHGGHGQAGWDLVGYGGLRSVTVRRSRRGSV